ncbi:MAG: hypothetical protein SGILL_004837, partial [Bacillariaceae sp.]
NERKSSVLKSLVVLDVDDRDADYLQTASSHGNSDYESDHSSRSARSTDSAGGRRRYMRRGSVTKHKLEADMIGMQPNHVSSAGANDESDYGSDYDSGLDAAEKQRRRYLRRGSVTKHKIEADRMAMQPTNHASSAAGAANNHESDYGSEYDSGLDAAEKQRRRYLRRGSVTKHKIEADMIGMQPTQKATVGTAESDYGSDYDSGVDEAEKQRRRYLRRGSVTKYSLDASTSRASMQPVNVAEGDASVFKNGGVVASKSSLPPPPTNNNSFDETETQLLSSPKGKSVSCHAKLLSTDDPPKQKQPTKGRRAGRPSRRGSMKMPSRPAVTDDYYSGNINDSGHHRKNLYFDSHEEALSPTPAAGKKSPPKKESPPKQCMKKTTSASMHSVPSMSPASASAAAEFHPITPAKPRSGRKLIVDEAELYSSFDDLDFSDHLETIYPSTHQPSLQERRESSSSRASSLSGATDDSSEASFCNESVEEYETKPPAVAPVNRSPRLPPAYLSTPKKLTSSMPATKSWKRYSSRRTRDDDSTVSSVSSFGSEEDFAQHPHRFTASGVKMNGYAGFTTSKKPARAKSAPETGRRSGPKSILSTDMKRSSHKKSVCFDRIIITEFPIILGDNPAVTSGAPVTIDWTAQGEKNYSLYAYERCRPARRRRRKLLISVSNRAILLLAAGYSIDEIADASINAQQIKFSRQESMNASQYREQVSLLMENTNETLNTMVQTTGKKLKSLVAKPVQHSASARTA